ncbi:MAG: helix-turn-helix domain-containing protein [Chloroflexi bacterium]|nr:helix-turn-helix domain-containing protein [Chloroflexota bacterium]
MSSKPFIEPNAIYSRAEAAHLLGIGLTTLKQMIRAGHLVVSQPEGIRRVFIKGSSILDMLDRTAQQPNYLAASYSQNVGAVPQYQGTTARLAQPVLESGASWNAQATLALRTERESASRQKSSRARGGARR